VEFEEWELTMPQTIRADSLWRVRAYRMALFAADVGWEDIGALVKDRRTVGLADQLYRALGSVSANVAEGYSRSTGKDRARFYEYALGSDRESREWYCNGRHVLTESVVAHRLSLHTDVIRLLLTMIPQQRGHTSREEPVWCEKRSTGGHEMP